MAKSAAQPVTTKSVFHKELADSFIFRNSRMNWHRIGRRINLNQKAKLLEFF
jgi:hypothetical protein